MRYKIMMGVPSSGGSLLEGCTNSTWLASRRHDVVRFPSGTDGLNFNTLWCEALNRGEAGEYTHFAFCHSDIEVVDDDPENRWCDTLIEAAERLDVAYVSVPMVIKDVRGVTSSGIGDPHDPWTPFRRFTVADLFGLPPAFTIDHTGHPDKYLIHNEGLSIIDLRWAAWYVPREGGLVQADFNVIERIQKRNGPLGLKWYRDQLTEDWKFSRDLWQMRIPTGICTRVKAWHYGRTRWPNWGDWGEYKDGDEDTAVKWRTQDAPATQGRDGHVSDPDLPNAVAAAPQH